MSSLTLNSSFLYIRYTAMTQWSDANCHSRLLWSRGRDTLRCSIDRKAWGVSSLVFGIDCSKYIIIHITHSTLFINALNNLLLHLVISNTAHAPSAPVSLPHKNFLMTIHLSLYQMKSGICQRMTIFPSGHIFHMIRRSLHTNTSCLLDWKETWYWSSGYTLLPIHGKVGKLFYQTIFKQKLSHIIFWQIYISNI